MSETPSSPASVAPGESPSAGADVLTQSARTEWMRQVNHVRKQEFAYLRSVQKRQAGEVSEPTLAGLPTRAQRTGTVRGDTLKKIDEIEAQLDSLWVSSRGKPSDSNFGASALVAGANTEFSTSVLAAPGVLTQMMHHSEMPASALLVQSLDAHAAKSALAATSGELSERAAIRFAPRGATTGAELPDEVLAKAAELFAQAQYELAEQHLTRSLRGNEMRSEHALRRLLALLDIYRATGNQAQFDWSVLEYFDFWDGHTPQWRRHSSTKAEAFASRDTLEIPKRLEKPNQPTGTRFWRCPSVLNRVVAQELQTHWSQGGNCTIDWTSLSTIEADAAVQLTAVFKAEQASPAQLMFIDTPNLLYVLEQATPIGSPKINRHLWQLRFCLLALMGMRAAFDAACTDFCLTYIEPAPLWRPSTVHFIGDALATTPVMPEPPGNSPWYLHGHVLGETGLGLAEPTPGPLQVDCATLVRMDTSATALLLRWLRKAAARSSEVHFNDVGLLLGAAWHAAGVEALAHVHLRDAP